MSDCRADFSRRYVSSALFESASAHAREPGRGSLESRNNSRDNNISAMLSKIALPSNFPRALRERVLFTVFPVVCSQEWRWLPCASISCKRRWSRKCALSCASSSTFSGARDDERALSVILHHHDNRWVCTSNQCVSSIFRREVKLVFRAKQENGSANSTYIRRCK